MEVQRATLPGLSVSYILPKMMIVLEWLIRRYECVPDKGTVVKRCINPEQKF